MIIDPAADWQAMVLRQTLLLVVPLHIEEMRHLDGEQLAEIARESGAGVAHKGDVLQFGGKGCGEAFTALARGLAAAALAAWGGVTFDGMHWCRTPGCPAVDDDHPQPWPWTPRAVPPPRPVADVPVSEDVL